MKREEQISVDQLQRELWIRNVFLLVCFLPFAILMVPIKFGKAMTRTGRDLFGFFANLTEWVEKKLLHYIINDIMFLPKFINKRNEVSRLLIKKKARQNKELRND